MSGGDGETIRTELHALTARWTFSKSGCSAESGMTFLTSFPVSRTLYTMPGSETSSGKFSYIYVLESMKNGSLYIGCTNNLAKRIQEHNKKINFSTKSFAPWQIIYSEACLNDLDAYRREKFLKTSQGARLLKRRLKEYFYSKRNKHS